MLWTRFQNKTCSYSFKAFILSGNDLYLSRETFLCEAVRLCLLSLKCKSSRWPCLIDLSFKTVEREVKLGIEPARGWYHLSFNCPLNSQTPDDTNDYIICLEQIPQQQRAIDKELSCTAAKLSSSLIYKHYMNTRWRKCKAELLRLNERSFTHRS